MQGNLNATEILAKNISISETGTIHAQQTSCFGQMKVQGTNFQFDGRVDLYGDLIKIDNPDVNYVNEMVFDKPIYGLDSGNNLVKVYDISKSSVRFNGAARYKMMTEDLEEFLFNTVFSSLKSNLKDHVHGNIGWLTLLDAGKEYISIFTDDISGAITRVCF